MFALLSCAVGSARNTGIRAPVSITAAGGSVISRQQGRIFVHCLDSQCPHCRGTGFMRQANLEGKGQLPNDADAPRILFPFTTPPAGLVLEDGVQKTMLLQFEEQEPGATLGRISFIY